MLCIKYNSFKILRHILDLRSLWGLEPGSEVSYKCTNNNSNNNYNNNNNYNSSKENN